MEGLSGSNSRCENPIKWCRYRQAPMWTTSSAATTGSRYPSDLTDEEWSLVAADFRQSVAVANARWRCGRWWNGVMYVLSTGCQWRDIPQESPPRSTLYTTHLTRRNYDWDDRHHYARQRHAAIRLRPARQPA